MSHVSSQGRFSFRAEVSKMRARVGERVMDGQEVGYVGLGDGGISVIIIRGVVTHGLLLPPLPSLIHCIVTSFSG